MTEETTKKDDAAKKIAGEFKKESVANKIYLACALVVLASSFFPWTSASYGIYINYSINGWHSWGLISVIASIAIIAHWVTQKLNIKLGINLPAEEQLKKILASAMLAGPIMWLVATNFMLSIAGIGLLIALAASLVAFYFAFKSFIDSKIKKVKS